MKCSGEHLAKSCPKTAKQVPACCNYGSAHTAYYRGCPYYKHVSSLSPAPTKLTIKQPAQPLANLPSDSKSANTSYSTAILGKNLKPQISNAQIIKLLTELLVAITSSDTTQK